MNGNRGRRGRGYVRHGGNMRGMARDLNRDMEENQEWEQVEVGLDMGDLWETKIGGIKEEKSEKSEK